GVILETQVLGRANGRVETLLARRAGVEAIEPDVVRVTLDDREAGPERGLEKGRRHLGDPVVDGRDGVGEYQGPWRCRGDPQRIRGAVPVERRVRTFEGIEREGRVRREALLVEALRGKGHVG